VVRVTVPGDLLGDLFNGSPLGDGARGGTLTFTSTVNDIYAAPPAGSGRGNGRVAPGAAATVASARPTPASRRSSGESRRRRSAGTIEHYCRRRPRRPASTDGRVVRGPGRCRPLLRNDHSRACRGDAEPAFPLPA
jgi:hypothetical protein